MFHASNKEFSNVASFGTVVAEEWQGTQKSNLVRSPAPRLRRNWLLCTVNVTAYTALHIEWVDRRKKHLWQKCEREMDTDSLIPELDESSPTPLYHQMTLHFQRLIQEGVLVPGDQLPSERHLAEQTGVSRMTVRQAVRGLVSGGYCEHARGRGIYVRKRPVVIDSRSFEGFTANTKRQGLDSATKALSSRLVLPPEPVREALELAPREKVVELTRLRLISGRPAVLETEWFPAKRFERLLHEDMSRSLYGILEEVFGMRIGSTTDVIRPYLPDNDECALLDLRPGSAVILRDRVGADESGVPVEVVKSVYNPDQYEFRMTLVPAQAGDRTQIN
jgi:GntR family transcriptional regulator